MSKWILILILGAIGPWLAGCESVQDATLTGRMWEATGSNHREPAGNSNLGLYQTSNNDDVLVRYKEELEGNGKIKSRAFLLLANEKKLKAGQRPAFLSADKASQIQGHPLQVISKADTNALAKEDLQAIISPDGHHFTLVFKGKDIGTYCLPTYGIVSTGGKVTRALLLPATVAGDVTVYSAVFGGMAAYFAAWEYAHNPPGTGFSFRP